jgi:hypothetical protein
MKSISAFLSLIPLVPLFAAGPATAQSPQPQAASTSPVAYVYVGTSKGVELYNAAVNGQLSLVHGSPFPITGMAAGSNGKYFVSLGTYLLHTYAVSSTGTIGAQVSQIDTQDYYGNGNCEGVKQGTEGLANLDHTGQNLYVAFPSLDGGCDESIQSPASPAATTSPTPPVLLTAAAYPRLGSGTPARAPASLRILASNSPPTPPPVNTCRIM